MKQDRVHATFKTSIAEIFADLQVTPHGAVAKASMVDAHIHGDWTIVLFDNGGTGSRWQRAGRDVAPPLEAELPISHQEALRIAANSMFAWVSAA